MQCARMLREKLILDLTTFQFVLVRLKEFGASVGPEPSYESLANLVAAD